MKRRNLILIIAACLLGVALAGGLAWRTGLFAHQGSATVGGPFHLVDVNGKPVDQAVLKGKWSAVFFGFTSCPAVCPTTLQAMAAAQDRLGPKADQLQVVFISVDPERDTPAQLKAYLANEAFPKGVIGLTGSPAQVEAVTKAYRVFYQRSGDGADYLVNHSTATYLMNPKGRFDRVLPFGVGPDELVRQISQAMRED
jgi:protein SCO1